MVGFEQRVVAGIGIGLQDAGIADKMRLWMFTAAIARIVEQRRRRCGAAERAIVADIRQDPSRVGLELGKHRNRGVVTMQALSRKDMRRKEHMQWAQCRCTGANLVGERRQAELDALQRIAVALAVERLMLAELLEQDRGE